MEPVTSEEWHPDSVPGDQHCSGADAEVTSGRGLLSVAPGNQSAESRHGGGRGKACD